MSKTWKWFGNAGHFIGSSHCRFHLTTLVGEYLVSTVGQLWWGRGSQEIHAEIYDPEWFAKNRHHLGYEWDNAYMQKFGYDDIGSGRKFETMVFKAGKRCNAKGCGCGLPSISGSERDGESYNDAGAATRGHLAMCEKWKNGEPPDAD